MSEEMRYIMNLCESLSSDINDINTQVPKLLWDDSKSVKDNTIILLNDIIEYIENITKADNIRSDLLRIDGARSIYGSLREFLIDINKIIDSLELNESITYQHEYLLLASKFESLAKGLESLGNQLEQINRKINNKFDILLISIRDITHKLKVIHYRIKNIDVFNDYR